MRCDAMLYDVVPWSAPSRDVNVYARCVRAANPSNFSLHRNSDMCSNADSDFKDTSTRKRQGARRHSSDGQNHVFSNIGIYSNLLYSSLEDKGWVKCLSSFCSVLCCSRGPGVMPLSKEQMDLNTPIQFAKDTPKKYDPKHATGMNRIETLE